MSTNRGFVRPVVPSPTGMAIGWDIQSSIEGFQTPPTLEGKLPLDPDRFVTMSGLGVITAIEGDLWGENDPLERDDPEPELDDEIEVLVTRLVHLESDRRYDANQLELDTLDSWGVNDYVERADRISGVYPTQSAPAMTQSCG